MLRFSTGGHASGLSLALLRYSNHRLRVAFPLQLTTDLLAHVPKRRKWETRCAPMGFQHSCPPNQAGGNPCSTMRYWVSCELCRGSRMLRQGRPPNTATAHTHVPRTAGRAIEWHCRATHPPVASTLTSLSTSEPRGDNG